ncbi:phosphatidylglycerol lysyltransferase domain-containing protein [Cytobacillus massiliigabonensis]|uniref:phosphatidylglycerol lysyltransferase domain-containing protein n=1 Tax=Cytobacillus massiliigabonensis TaxID=1871011 RepID=UPI000C815C44|nr:phosphatidylglycerol lysyltransferase domain-containing protein [Cytobacillus massiliigabonensis]
MFNLNISFNKKQIEMMNPIHNNNDLQYDQLTSFLKENGGNHVSHLIYLKDKEMFWTKEQDVLFVYQRISNKLIVLGDPIGEEAKIHAAIKEFCEFSKRKGLKPVFYQISPQYMQYYHDSGYRFLKVAETGLVNLQQFSLDGKKGAKLRTKLNKFTRNNFTFSVVHPPYSDQFLSEIKHISDSWLGSQKEKGFSVVSFSKEYVSLFPIALLHGPAGNIIAFATLATDYKNTITIDLMRKYSDSPYGTMDVLFIHIFHWAKNNSYQTCSLGMTPLSNVGTCKHSFTSEKLIRLVYLYGNSMYNFKGLKEFKSKFTSNWEPKYLAYKKTILPLTLLQLLVLINYKRSARNPMKKKSNSLKNTIANGVLNDHNERLS